jgi:hypothetical protein
LGLVVVAEVVHVGIAGIGAAVVAGSPGAAAGIVVIVGEVAHIAVEVVVGLDTVALAES